MIAFLFNVFATACSHILLLSTQLGIRLSIFLFKLKPGIHWDDIYSAYMKKHLWLWCIQPGSVSAAPRLFCLPGTLIWKLNSNKVKLWYSLGTVIEFFLVPFKKYVFKLVETIAFKVIFLWWLGGNDLWKKFSSFRQSRLDWVHFKAQEGYLLNGGQIWLGACKTGECNGTFLSFVFLAHSPAMWHHEHQPHQQGQVWEHPASCQVLGMALETTAPLAFQRTGHKAAWGTLNNFEPTGSQGLGPMDLETPWVKMAPRRLCYGGQSGAAGGDLGFNWAALSMTAGETEASLLICHLYWVC